MRTLGVNGGADTLFLAVAEDDEVVDVKPYTFSEPVGLPAVLRLPALRNEAVKLVRSLAVERVRILDPETSWSTPAVLVRSRFALETLLALGAADAAVDCERLSRGSVRALLDLPKKGPLHTLVPQVTPKVGGQWKPRMRDLAALAALAAERQG